MEALMYTQGSSVTGKVDDRITQALCGDEIDRQVQEIIVTPEAFSIQDVQEYFSGTFGWQVSQDDRGRFWLRAFFASVADRITRAVASAGRGLACA